MAMRTHYLSWKSSLFMIENLLKVEKPHSSLKTNHNSTITPLPFHPAFRDEKLDVKHKRKRIEEETEEDNTRMTKQRISNIPQDLTSRPASPDLYPDCNASGKLSIYRGVRSFP